MTRARLPKAVFDFIDGGAEDERARHANSADFDDWHLMPRFGIDVSSRTMQTAILGRSARLPLVISPTGMAGFYWRDGEQAAARAAARHGIPFCLSTNSIASLEQVAKAAPDGDRWFQLYFLRDRDWMKGLLRRAADADYRVLCLTIDLPVAGRRERDLRNGFSMPLKFRLSNALDMARCPGWLIDVARSILTFGNFQMDNWSGFTAIAQHVSTLFDPSATWDDIAEIREIWRGKLAIKGILHPEDAARAVGIGADAVIVSNHGGRQLDHSPSAISALPDIAAAVGDRSEIILDGGVKRGTDILKALALGANACSIGRSYLWGLAAGGEAGVSRALDLFAGELDNAMALLGTRSIAEVRCDHVRHRHASTARAERAPPLRVAANQMRA
jgi:isopentenyl diphosphate isomerase/L-lactate dehydrogenase-like FMN-dependent dehydrogenase